MLSVEREGSGAKIVRNTLNEMTGIQSRQESYIVNIPVGKKPRAEFATFAWGDSNRSNIKGHANHPPVFYSSKDQHISLVLSIFSGDTWRFRM